MFSELREIITKNEDHSFIIAIDLELTKNNFDLDSLKEILIIDIIKQSLSEEILYGILSDIFTYEFIKKVLLKNLQYFKTDKHLILVLKIQPLKYNE